jgi:hypothetical protein
MGMMIAFGILGGVGSLVAGAGAVVYSCGPAQIVGIPLAIINKKEANRFKKEKERLEKKALEDKQNAVKDTSVTDYQLDRVNESIKGCDEAAKKHMIRMIPVVGTIVAATRD